MRKEPQEAVGFRWYHIWRPIKRRIRNNNLNEPQTPDSSSWPFQYCVHWYKKTYTRLYGFSKPLQYRERHSSQFSIFDPATQLCNQPGRRIPTHCSTWTSEITPRCTWKIVQLRQTPKFADEGCDNYMSVIFQSADIKVHEPSRSIQVSRTAIQSRSRHGKRSQARMQIGAQRVYMSVNTSIFAHIQHLRNLHRSAPVRHGPVRSRMDRGAPMDPIF
ncbi:hypothetical protein V8E55_009232 [Tylopilus felleus]